METGKLKKFAQAGRRDLIRQVKGKLEQVLAEGSLARREQAAAVVDLERQIQAQGREEVIERAAYTWFNRFTALRFMDAHRYNRIMTVSPAEGQTQPEILAEAKQGHIDERIVPEKVRERVLALLDGRTPSRDAQGEAYRLLLVAVCNYWHHAMPFLFERIADWTELLMPDDLLSDTAVRTRIRSALTAEDCQDVEVIGWLYQFYISEKKDEVFAGLKKNQKITPKNIPAATQLFTPHWIVRYLVENSLGRLWLLNRPQSALADRMDYYIAPEEPETDFLNIEKPEDLRICDPACGSGHMLTYAFDLLHAIYEEEGYDPAEIPGRILQNNLYGIEIDDRAGALAAFALMMKAAERLGRRKFLRLDVQPNICVLQNVTFREDELNDYMAEVGRDLFTAELRETLGQFEQAKNVGSLIQPVLQDSAEVRRVLASRDFEGNLFLSGTHQRVLEALEMAEFLAPTYHVVVANPPYGGSKGLNAALTSYLNANFKEGKSDLFASFTLRILKILMPSGWFGIMCPSVWMHIPSLEALRKKLLGSVSISTLVELPLSGFRGATVQICAYTAQVKSPSKNPGTFISLLRHSGGDEAMSAATLVAASDPNCSYRFHKHTEDFSSIPGNSISYALGGSTYSAFASFPSISEFGDTGSGLQTSDNDRFLRQWFEVSRNRACFSAQSRKAAQETGARWFPHKKGGAYRKWYGNNEYVLNWENDGQELFAFATKLYGSPTRIIKNTDRYFTEGITWSHTTSYKFSARILSATEIFNVEAPALFGTDTRLFLPYLCSKVAEHFLSVSNPGLHFVSSSVGFLPVAIETLANRETLIESHFEAATKAAKSDWDDYETSWGFTKTPWLSQNRHSDTIETTYSFLRTRWREMTRELQRLEEDNNRIFIDAYGLQDELTSEVPLKEITLTCNPAYRYGGKLNDEEREKRLLADTMAEFLSYAIGCMFGRYSLDEPGLILANQGERLSDYLARIPNPTFMPDEDNVIPILDDTWFSDDIVERFHEFLRLTFGEAHFQENLAFIEIALGKPLRRYFVKDFYKDHVQRYKKRPIYWLFSSPKGSFNALIYMHRSRADTVSVILNDYLREFRTKLAARVQQLEEIEASTSSSARDKTVALKEITKLRDTIAELEDWERKVMLPLASERIEIDLDDGVKANYPKFGSALAKVPGLSA